MIRGRWYRLNNNWTKAVLLDYNISTIIKEMNPVYKDMKIEDTYHFENKEHFIKWNRIRLTHYIGFDNKSHSLKERFEEGIYNLKERRPSLL